MKYVVSGRFGAGENPAVLRSRCRDEHSSEQQTPHEKERQYSYEFGRAGIAGHDVFRFVAERIPDEVLPGRQMEYRTRRMVADICVPLFRSGEFVTDHVLEMYELPPLQSRRDVVGVVN